MIIGWMQYDCATFCLSIQPHRGKQTLKAIDKIKKYVLINQNVLKYVSNIKMRQMNIYAVN